MMVWIFPFLGGVFAAGCLFLAYLFWNDLDFKTGAIGMFAAGIFEIVITSLMIADIVGWIK